MTLYFCYTAGVNSSSENKKLSIIIPVFNERATLAELINRVQAVDFLPWQREVIVVDDGSSDNTAILWTINGLLLCVFSGHKDSVISVAINDDKILTGSCDKHLCLWSTKDRTTRSIKIGKKRHVETRGFIRWD